MTLPSFLNVDLPCDRALQMTKRKLSRAGLRALQTFDLHAARAGGLHECACPHHGTEDCDCQMVVLLVYGNAEQPVTLFLHGNDGQTWLSIADTPPQRIDPNLLAQIRAALEAAEVFPRGDRIFDSTIEAGKRRHILRVPYLSVFTKASNE